MRLLPTGQVVCPPDKGGWSGRLEWRTLPEPSYWLEYDIPEYDTRRRPPDTVKVYFDLGQLARAIALKKQEVDKLQAQVEGLMLLQVGVSA